VLSLTLPPSPFPRQSKTQIFRETADVAGVALGTLGVILSTIALALVLLQWSARNGVVRRFAPTAGGDVEAGRPHSASDVSVTRDVSGWLLGS
jgi:hypothetical protein